MITWIPIVLGRWLVVTWVRASHDGGQNPTELGAERIRVLGGARQGGLGPATGRGGKRRRRREEGNDLFS